MAAGAEAAVVVDVEAAVDNQDLTEVPLIGVGYRHPLADWILERPESVQCLEITAEHFFDDHDQRLARLSQDFPLFVHGLGLSLGTPGPLDPQTLANFKRVVDIARPRWISEHVAFCRSDEVELGHLNPIPTSKRSLQTLVDNARALSDACQQPLILENITTHMSMPGELSETEFLNQLCDKADCGLLLDITNLFINARNHEFDPVKWLAQIELSNVVQLHIVGYSFHNGQWLDHHGAAIQDELIELMQHVIARSPARAVIVERDAHFPTAQDMAAELVRLEEACESARLHHRTHSPTK